MRVASTTLSRPPLPTASFGSSGLWLATSGGSGASTRRPCSSLTRSQWVAFSVYHLILPLFQASGGWILSPEWYPPSYFEWHSAVSSCIPQPQIKCGMSLPRSLCPSHRLHNQQTTRYPSIYFCPRVLTVLHTDLENFYIAFFPGDIPYHWYSNGYWW